MKVISEVFTWLFSTHFNEYGEMVSSGLLLYKLHIFGDSNNSSGCIVSTSTLSIFNFLQLLIAIFDHVNRRGGFGTRNPEMTKKYPLSVNRRNVIFVKRLEDENLMHSSSNMITANNRNRENTMRLFTRTYSQFPPKHTNMTRSYS